MLGARTTTGARDHSETGAARGEAPPLRVLLRAARGAAAAASAVALLAVRPAAVPEGGRQRGGVPAAPVALRVAEARAVTPSDATVAARAAGGKIT